MLEALSSTGVRLKDMHSLSLSTSRSHKYAVSATNMLCLPQICCLSDYCIFDGCLLRFCFGFDHVYAGGNMKICYKSVLFS